MGTLEALLARGETVTVVEFVSKRGLDTTWVAVDARGTAVEVFSTREEAERVVAGGKAGAVTSKRLQLLNEADRYGYNVTEGILYCDLVKIAGEHVLRFVSDRFERETWWIFDGHLIKRRSGFAEASPSRDRKAEGEFCFAQFRSVADAVRKIAAKRKK